ncbi:MAG TPA: hypothetical protein PL185_10995 [Flavobacteriales bacterium]|nr:hypothetical protein [Flavobacteriales bacterium]
MKNLLLILVLITTLNSFSQSVEIIHKSENRNLPEGKIFAFIEPTTDTSQIKYVATILARDKNKKSNIEFLYFEIRKEATKIGANCFRVKSFERGGKRNEAILILDCYVANETTLKQNTKNHENNVVYIFGGERDDDKSTSFKINGVEIELRSGTYYKLSLKPDEEIRISKGGFTGSTITLNWEEGKELSFYSLSGLGLAAMEKQPMNGISFNTGSVNRMGNISLGLLLAYILKQAN